MTAALVATLVANLFYLTMTFYYFYVFAVLAVALPVVFGRARGANVKVLVLTTSYPRHADDVAGVFVRDAVEHLREAGLEVDVVSPASFPHFGLAYGHGIVGQPQAEALARPRAPALPRSPSRARRAALRAAPISCTRTGFRPRCPRSRRASRSCVQLWGTDVELARRAPWAFRWLLRRARLVLCPSAALAEAARGARRARRPGRAERRRRSPHEVASPEEPPHVLYVGRLSEEKGVAELARGDRGAAARDRRRRAAAGRRARRRSGSSRRQRSAQYYERAAVVACPSRREGYGVVAREAMAYGRAVVASAVGGLVDAVEDGVTGLLVPPRDPAALRAALERLLARLRARRRLGRRGAGEGARASSRGTRATEATIAAYRAALAELALTRSLSSSA